MKEFSLMAHEHAVVDLYLVPPFSGVILDHIFKSRVPGGGLGGQRWWDELVEAHPCGHSGLQAGEESCQPWCHCYHGTAQGRPSDSQGAQ